MINRHDDIDMIERYNDTDYTTLRLYLVCECGEDEDWLQIWT